MYVKNKLKIKGWLKKNILKMVEISVFGFYQILFFLILLFLDPEDL